MDQGAETQSQRVSEASPEPSELRWQPEPLSTLSVSSPDKSSDPGNEGSRGGVGMTGSYPPPPVSPENTMGTNSPISQLDTHIATSPLWSWLCLC